MTTLLVLHVLATAVWVGGTIALVFTAVPTLRTLSLDERTRSVKMLGRRWKPIGWGALLLLGGTGAGLAFGYWNAADPDVLFHSRFGHLLIAKAILFVLLVASAFLHDFVIGPRLNRQMREGRTATLRRPMITVGWTSFVLTITLPILGVLLTR